MSNVQNLSLAKSGKLQEKLCLGRNIKVQFGISTFLKAIKENKSKNFLLSTVYQNWMALSLELVYQEFLFPNSFRFTY